VVASVAPILEITPLGDVWAGVVNRLTKSEVIAALVRELALQSQLVSQTDGVWTLQVDNALLANPAHAEKLQTALQTIESSAKLQVQAGSVVDTPAKRLAKAAAELQAAAEALILNDPAVQQLMREFDAKIVPNSIKPIKLTPPHTIEKENDV
jgi:DNA polymerase-3 subunit gamma/tau